MYSKVKDKICEIMNFNISDFILNGCFGNYFKRINRVTQLWQIFFKVLLKTITKVFFNPSFWIFCILALGIGSIGLWIGVFSGKNFLYAIETSGKETILTFCIALLGSIAVEQYFNRSSEKSAAEKTAEDHMMGHIAILGWNFAFAMSFYSYFIKESWYYGLVITVIFWISYTVYNPIFDALNNKALENLRADYKYKSTTTESSIDESEGDLGGSGL